MAEDQEVDGKRWCYRHGLHDDWRVVASSGVWRCRACRRADLKSARIKRNCAAILSAAGPEAVEAYLRAVSIRFYVRPEPYLRKAKEEQVG